jgi:hypothetical protein
MKKYEQSRRCVSCGSRESRYLTLVETLSEITKNWAEPCPTCKGKNFAGSGDIPSITRESLEVWGRDENLWFIGQDEDLMFDEENSELMFEFLNDDSILKSKKYILLQALCSMASYNQDIKKELLTRTRIFQELEHGKEVCSTLFSK